MSDATQWWLLAGGLVALELVTGTFYLLMLAIGLAAGALAAHLGAGVTLQWISAALVGVAAVLVWQRWGLPRRQGAETNQDVNLDIGQMVQVAQWQPDGTAHVRYRGADWTVALAEGHRPPAADSALTASSAPIGPASYRIVAVQGSRLIVQP